MADGIARAACRKSLIAALVLQSAFVVGCSRSRPPSVEAGVDVTREVDPGASRRPNISTRKRPDAIAIVIGIDRYRATLPRASGAENDARAFAAYAEHSLA